MGAVYSPSSDHNTPAPEAKGGFVLRQDQVLDSKGVGPGPERKRYDEEDRREPEQDDEVAPPNISDLRGSVGVDGDRAHASRSNII